MASPMQKAASNNLKKNSSKPGQRFNIQAKNGLIEQYEEVGPGLAAKPLGPRLPKSSKQSSLLGGLIEQYKSIFPPGGRDNPLPIGPQRKQMDQLEAVEHDTYSSPKPESKPKSDVVNYPNFNVPRFDRKANDPREIARRRREGKE